MTTRQPLDLQQFWKMRGTQSFCITHYVSYPSGAVLAWLLARLGISPSAVTIAGGLTAWIGAGWVGLGVQDPKLGAVALFLALMLSYSLDCADGVLARATRTASPFGAVLDKVFDAATMIVVPGLLCIGASARPPLALPADAYPFIALAIVASRVLLGVTVWLKDFTVKRADHLVDDRRQRTPQWYLRRFIGQTTDTPMFYLLLAGTWWLGGFWEALAAYALWIFLVWGLYLTLSARDMRQHHEE